MTLQGRTGTETATRDLALGLFTAGDEPIVYTPRPGGIANELRKFGLPVVDELHAIKTAPDIIHGHHYVETLQALARFPRTPAIFVTHDANAWHDVPPVSPRIAYYVAVDTDTRERLVERYHIPPDRVRLICNSFDPARFARREALPDKPGRALVFSNYATSNSFLQAVEQACAEVNLPLDVIGSGVNNLCDNPSEILHDYHLVFGIARCAIEAMATGAAVILCGADGLGSLVTRENIMDIHRNYGRGVLNAPIDKDLIVAEIKKYDPADALAVCEYVRSAVSLDRMIQQYRSLYAGVIGLPVPPETDPFVAALESTARQAARFEQESKALFSRKHSTALPPEISRHVALKIVDCPSIATSAFVVAVDLDNQSDESFASYPPFPVQLSYHWFSASGTLVVFEGIRTPLPRLIYPHQKQTCNARIELPAEAGDYHLCVTLVQEYVMWFDRVDPPVVAWAAVEVRSDDSRGVNHSENRR
jgi:hypothetical protein